MGGRAPTPGPLGSRGIVADDYEHTAVQQQREAVNDWWFTLDNLSRDDALGLDREDCIDEAMGVDLLMHGVVRPEQLRRCRAEDSGYRQPQALVDFLAGVRCA